MMKPGKAKTPISSSASQLLAKADAARDTRAWSTAAEYYATYLKQQPNDADVVVQYAHALKESGDLHGASQAYRRVLKLFPGRQETRLHLAHCLKNAGLLSEALVEFRLLKEAGVFAEDVDAHLERMLPNLFQEAGDKHRDCRRWSQAEADYAACLALDPNRADIWIQLAHARKESGVVADAIVAYEEAARRAPHSPEPWVHLAHLLRTTGPRDRSLRAFARAWALGCRTSELIEAMRNAAGYSTAEMCAIFEREFRELGRGMEHLPEFVLGARSGITGPVPDSKPSLAPGAKPDIVYLSGIDWGYRRQRPQNMAMALGKAGHRVFFVSTVFDAGERAPGFADLGCPALNVFEIRLRSLDAGTGSLHFGMNANAVAATGDSLAAACRELCSSPPVIIVDHPMWHPLCRRLTRALLVYDCIDNVCAFPGSPPALAASEAALITDADLIITPSTFLARKVAAGRPTVVIPNACDIAHFQAVSAYLPPKDRVLIVYYGAIAAWFDAEWIEVAARNRPHWSFRLIGEYETKVVDHLRQLPNIQLVGEVPYAELPRHLREANVAIIPFRLDELTLAVNPVKVYEYLAAGRPVVASALPELKTMPGVRTVNNAHEFIEAIDHEASTDSPEAHVQRSKWAAGQDWTTRAADMSSAIAAEISKPVRSSKQVASTDTRSAPVRGLPFADFILFIAPFPKSGIVVEGWMARIRAVDEIFADEQRIYLHFTRDARADEEPRWVQQADNAFEVYVHPTSALHHRLIALVIKECRFCYVQTVHLARYVIGFYPTGKMITDFHGIVPEEEVMQGNPDAALFYEGIESTVMQCSQHVVVVTEAMARHLLEKYPFATCEPIVLPIVTTYGSCPAWMNATATEDVSVIYSGGSQVWQNIDRMLDLIARAPLNARYVIASHDHVAIAKRADARGVKDRMQFGVFSREQLPEVYGSADFGFVLRDDTPVNRVACPTKLTEYLLFGIIPIVSLIEIGDFAALGYEYVTEEEFAVGLIPGRQQRLRICEHNRGVVHRLQERFHSSSLRLRQLAPPCRIPSGEFCGLPSINPLGQMPWKREVYVFGGTMHYVAQDFFKPYEEAEFHFAKGSRGELLRIIPMTNDFIGRVNSVHVTAGEAFGGEAVLAQSRATPMLAADFFSAEAPFIEIRFSAPIELVEVRFTMTFKDHGPAAAKLAFATRNEMRDAYTISVTIESHGSARVFNLPLQYV